MKKSKINSKNQKLIQKRRKNNNTKINSKFTKKGEKLIKKRQKNKKINSKQFDFSDFFIILLFVILKKLKKKF